MGDNPNMFVCHTNLLERFFRFRNFDELIVLILSPRKTKLFSTKLLTYINYMNLDT